MLAIFDRSGQDIRKEIITEVMQNEFLIDPKKYKLTVKDGVVTLSGVPETAELGRDLIAADLARPGSGRRA